MGIRFDTASPTDAAPRFALRGLPIGLCLLWGGNVPAMRIALEYLSPLQATWARFSLATIALFFLGSSLRALPWPSTTMFLHFVFLGLIATGIFAAMNAALLYAAPADVAVLFYTHPLLTAVLAHCLLPGERLTVMSAAGLALGFAGAAVTVTASLTGANSAYLAGAILALFSAFLQSVHTVYIKRMLSAARLLPLLFYSTAASAIILTVALPFAPGALSAPTPPARMVLALCYQGLVASALCNAVWILLLARLPAGTLSSYTFLTPAFGVLACFAVLRAPIPPHLLVGLAFVAGGLLLIDHGLHSFVPADDYYGRARPSPTRSPDKPLEGRTIPGPLADSRDADARHN